MTVRERSDRQLFLAKSLLEKSCNNHANVFAVRCDNTPAVADNCGASQPRPLGLLNRSPMRLLVLACIFCAVCLTHTSSRVLASGADAASSPSPVATDPPYPLFLNGTRADVQGTAMEAIRLAYGRWSPSHPGPPQASLRDVVVMTTAVDGGSVLVQFWHVVSDPDVPRAVALHEDYMIAPKQIAPLPVPSNGKLSNFGDPLAEVTLPGLHVAAFLVAAIAWDAHRREHHILADARGNIREFDVVIVEAVKRNRLIYAVGFSDRVLIHDPRYVILGCDFQWDIDATSFAVGPTQCVG